MICHLTLPEWCLHYKVLCAGDTNVSGSFEGMNNKLSESGVIHLLMIAFTGQQIGPGIVF